MTSNLLNRGVASLSGEGGREGGMEGKG